MFSVLYPAEPCPGVLARRAQKKYLRRCEPERIKPSGCLPFFIMPVLNGKHGVDWLPVRDKLGKCASRVIAPRDLALPDSLGFNRYIPQRIIPSLVFNTALYAVSGCGKEIRPFGVTVTDRSALLTGSVCSLLPYVSQVRVITSFPDRYADCAETAMRDYGASMIISEGSGNLIENDIIICADSFLPAVRAKVVFSQAKSIRGCLNITGSGISLGDELERILPKNIDHYDFAGALAELCGCSRLLRERFESPCADGCECDYPEISSLLLRVLLGSECGNT